MVIDLKPYGTAPVHKTDPLFNVLHPLETIANIYEGSVTETAQCLLNEDRLLLVRLFTQIMKVIYTINEDYKLLAYYPKTLDFATFDTNMDVIPAGYGPDYGKLIITT